MYSNQYPRQKFMDFDLNCIPNCIILPWFCLQGHTSNPKPLLSSAYHKIENQCPIYWRYKPFWLSLCSLTLTFKLKVISAVQNNCWHVHTSLAIRLQNMNHRHQIISEIFALRPFQLKLYIFTFIFDTKDIHVIQILPCYRHNSGKHFVKHEYPP